MGDAWIMRSHEDANDVNGCAIMPAAFKPCVERFTVACGVSVGVTTVSHSQPTFSRSDGRDECQFTQ